MKPERRSSFINRSFRRSFRRKKAEDERTPEEIEAERNKTLIELKKAVEDISEPQQSDRFFLDVLKARDYDLKESIILCRSNVNLLKFIETGMRDDLPQIVEEHGVGGFLGFDKDGNVVRLVNFGTLDMKGYVHGLNTLDLFVALLNVVQQDLALMEERNKKTGKKACQILFLIDMEGFSIHQLMYKPVQETIFSALKLHRDLFYDVIKDVLIINAPSLFPTIYKIVKPAVHEHLNKKIKVLSDKWRDELLEVIDADVLPMNIGGTRVDSNGDPKCSEFISYPGEIPQSLYTQPEEFLQVGQPDVKEVVVAAGSTVNVAVPVESFGIRLDVCIMSMEHDLAVALFYDPDLALSKKKMDDKDLPKLEQIIPVVRVQCNLKPLRTFFKPWRIGTYMLHLNNSYSWMAPKTVLYKITSSQS